MSQRWRTIVAVVTDPFAKEQLAATKAAVIARRCGARLILLNTFMIPQPVSDVPMDSREQIMASAIRQRRACLEALAKRWRHPKQRVRCVVEWDYPAHDAIIRAALREKADLVVAHSSRHGRIARWVLANTDWELIRHCPLPIWFVRDAKLPARPKLVVAVDPLHARAKPARLDDRLLATATALAERVSASIQILHAYQAPTASAGALLEPIALPSAAYATQDFVQSLQRGVRRLAERHDLDAASCELFYGEPADAVPAFVKKRRADVLVMGAVSRSALTRPIIGNTAEKVIDHVDCDVLVVKPAGFKSAVPKTVKGRRP